MAAQKSGHGLRQLVFGFAALLSVGGEKEHQAQHIAAAEDGRGHRHPRR